MEKGRKEFEQESERETVIPLLQTFIQTKKIIDTTAMHAQYHTAILLLFKPQMLLDGLKGIQNALKGCQNKLTFTRP